MSPAVETGTWLPLWNYKWSLFQVWMHKAYSWDEPIYYQIRLVKEEGNRIKFFFSWSWYWSECQHNLGKLNTMFESPPVLDHHQSCKYFLPTVLILEIKMGLKSSPCRRSLISVAGFQCNNRPDTKQIPLSSPSLPDFSSYYTFSHYKDGINARQRENHFPRLFYSESEGSLLLMLLHKDLIKSVSRNGNTSCH